MTSKERKELRRRLEQWLAPETMLAIADEAGDRIGCTSLFNQAGLTFLTDALTAGEFGRLRQADGVRLISGEWPDFEIKIGDSVEHFEAVEADDPARRRGEEYANESGKIVVEKRNLSEIADMLPTHAYRLSSG